jgi:hypothetical protein
MRGALRSSLVLCAVVCLPMAAACSSSDGPQAPSAEDVPFPFTGLPGYSPTEAPTALTVKVENTEAGRPQLGLGAADVVVQELVEGGLTRLAAIFHSTYPSEVGPIRSMRETDIGIVLPTGGPLAASGGESATVTAIQAAGVTTVTDGSPGFFRDPDRRVPYDLMLDVGAAVAELPPSPPPQPYFDFGSVPADASGTPAAGIDLRWPSAQSSFGYDPEAGQWVRTDLADATGFAFGNVVAIELPVSYSGSTDAAGSLVPTMVTTGSGSGVVATAGAVYDVAWSKASLSSPWKFTVAASGGGEDRQAFPLPPGRTWLALLPKEGGSVEVTPAQASGAAATPGG